MSDVRPTVTRLGGLSALVVVCALVVSACSALPGAGSGDIEASRSGDGVLDCGDGQVVRVVDTAVSDTSETDVVRVALAEWTAGGGDTVAVPSLELWTVVIDGRDVAVAYPEINGDGTWTVHDVRTCGEPDTGPSTIDGEIDCATEFGWTIQGSIDPNIPGEASSPEEAIRATLERYAGRHGGDIALVGMTVGSLVVQQREVVVARATEVPAGGWVTITIVGCEGFE